MAPVIPSPMLRADSQRSGAEWRIWPPTLQYLCFAGEILRLRLRMTDATRTRHFAGLHHHASERRDSGRFPRFRLTPYAPACMIITQRTSEPTRASRECGVSDHARPKTNTSPSSPVGRSAAGIPGLPRVPDCVKRTQFLPAKGHNWGFDAGDGRRAEAGKCQTNPICLRREEPPRHGGYRGKCKPITETRLCFMLRALCDSVVKSRPSGGLQARQRQSVPNEPNSRAIGDWGFEVGAPGIREWEMPNEPNLCVAGKSAGHGWPGQPRGVAPTNVHGCVWLALKCAHSRGK